MPSIIEIIKRRFGEVVLIVFFQFAFNMLLEKMLLYVESTSEAANTSGAAAFFISAGAAVFAVLWMMLQLGFERSIYEEPFVQRRPGELMVIGKYFFWRVLMFDIVINFVIMTIGFFIVMIVNNFFIGKAMDKVPEWVYQVGHAGAMVIAAKYLLLIPAVIVVHDCRGGEAFGGVRAMEFFGKARGLLFVFLVWVGMMAGYAVVREKIADTDMELLADGVYSLAVAAAAMLMSLMALKFIIEETTTRGRGDGESARGTGSEGIHGEFDSGTDIDRGLGD